MPFNGESSPQKSMAVGSPPLVVRVNGEEATDDRLGMVHEKPADEAGLIPSPAVSRLVGDEKQPRVLDAACCKDIAPGGDPNILSAQGRDAQASHCCRCIAGFYLHDVRMKISRHVGGSLDSRSINFPKERWGTSLNDFRHHSFVSNGSTWLPVCASRKLAS